MTLILGIVIGIALMAILVGLVVLAISDYPDIDDIND